MFGLIPGDLSALEPIEKTQMNVACIDLDGVLIPELWPHIANVTGMAEPAITTREEPELPTTGGAALIFPRLRPKTAPV